MKAGVRNALNSFCVVALVVITIAVMVVSCRQRPQCTDEMRYNIRAIDNCMHAVGCQYTAYELQNALRSFRDCDRAGEVLSLRQKLWKRI